MLKILINFSKF
ncbi:hypothetical protein VC87395_003267A, partial [Vibrio paracholerae 87395]